jgi:hypothetical protein
MKKTIIITTTLAAVGLILYFFTSKKVDNSAITASIPKADIYGNEIVETETQTTEITENEPIRVITGESVPLPEKLYYQVRRNSDNILFMTLTVCQIGKLYQDFGGTGYTYLGNKYLISGTPINLVVVTQYFPNEPSHS